MIIAICGYNATGKTTVARAVKDALQRRNLSVEVRRFSLLYPGTYIGKKKQQRNPTISSTGNVGLRAMEGQRGGWNQRLSLVTFANLVTASCTTWWFALTSRRRVIVFDRFLYDRCIHFEDAGWGLRFAKWLCCRPELTLVLLPRLDEHEKRFRERLGRRHGLALATLSKDDLAELEMVHARYRAIAEQNSECVLVDTSDPDGIEQSLDAVAERVGRVFGSV